MAEATSVHRTWKIDTTSVYDKKTKTYSKALSLRDSSGKSYCIAIPEYLDDKSLLLFALTLRATVSELIK